MALAMAASLGRQLYDARSVSARSCSVGNAALQGIKASPCTESRYVVFLSLYSGYSLTFLKEWNGSFFKPTWLRDIGLRVQLGEDHQPGTYCVFGRDIHKNFVVLHTNGIHLVNVDFCGCTAAPGVPKLDIYKQLLRVDWYPATVLEPQTCATFELMKLFHLLSLEGKVSAYHFYRTLHHRTENSGIAYVHVGLLLLRSSFHVLLINLGSLSRFLHDGSQMEARENAQTSRARVRSSGGPGGGDGPRGARGGVSSLPCPRVEPAR